MRTKRGIRSKGSKESKFDEVFRENYQALFLYASKFIPEKDIVADLVHDVFEKIWTRFEDIEKINNIRAYLFSSIRNECLNYLRRQKVKEDYINYETYNRENELDYFLNNSTNLECASITCAFRCASLNQPALKS